MTNEAMNKLAQTVEDALYGAGLIDGAGAVGSDLRLLAAVSGGADSVALLRAMCLLRERRDISIVVCHVQHGLRGESSLADEDFTRELCDSLGVPIIVRRARLEGGMDDAGAETRARDERLRIFDELMRETRSDALMLAHHMNDQAETALMRLLRGAGAAGLRAIPPCTPFSRGVALRPFIGVEKREIVAALREAGQAWREDESNAKPCTPRNALRLQVFPALEALYPDAQRHIVNASEALRTDEECLSALADALYTGAALERGGVLAVRADALMSAPEALRRRALRRLYARGVELNGQTPDERQLGYGDTLRLSALARANAGETLNLPCGLMALRGARHIHIAVQGGEPVADAPPSEPMLVSADKERYAAPLVDIRLERGRAGMKPPRDARTVWLSAAVMKRAPVLRAPQSGDTVRPFGSGGSKPLRRYLTDCKLDAPFRRTLTVLAVGSEVLWIPALCTAEDLRADGAPEDCLIMYIEGEAPYAM